MADKTLVEDPVIPFDIQASKEFLDVGRSIDFSYAINGVGFLSAASDEFQYRRSLSQVLKQTFDNSNAPGDQSIGNYWLRSQTDWSAGAGIEYMEPVSEDRIQRSFWTSYGINPWNIGNLGLHHKMDKVKTIAQVSTKATSIMPVGTGYYLAAGSNLYYLTAALVDTPVSPSVFTGETVNNIAYGNGMVYFATNQAIYQIDVDSSPTTAYKKFTVPTAGSDTRVWFAKDRLIITSGGAVWDQAAPAAGSSTPTALAYASALYRTATSAVWTGAVATPSSVMMSMKGKSGSSIYRVTIDTTAVVPQLKTPSVIAEFPGNESVEFLSGYLGTFLVIGTSNGIRIGTLDQTGSALSYGPTIGSPVPSGNLYAYDRFMYYPTIDAGQGRSGMIRIDLSEIDADGRAAWASDERVPSGNTSVLESLLVKSDGTLMASTRDASSVSLFETSPMYEASGYLESSQVRFGTTELKYFDTLQVQMQPPQDGTVLVTALIDNANAYTLGTITSDYNSAADLKIPATAGGSHIQIRFELRPSDDGLVSPSIQSWQLRAMPALIRQRLLQIPLLCFDHERSARGVEYGYEGYAIDRWRSLETTVKTGVPFVYEDFITGESYRCVLEEITFVQKSPPSGASGFGGVIELTVRTLL